LLEVVFFAALASQATKNLGLYMPFPVPSRPWESISMDFVGGFPMSHRGHDYLFVMVDHFNKDVCAHSM
jgi:hypothetical protein